MTDERCDVAPPTSDDAFGAILLRCWRAHGARGTAAEIVEREDGFIGWSDPSRYFASYDDWDLPERLLADWAKGRVLDIGCGAGRHVLELARRGSDVTGIDVSPTVADIARRRGARARCADVFDYLDDCPDQPFDTFLMGGANLGILGSRERGRELLRRLRRVANPGARLLGVSSDPLDTANPVHHEYARLNVASGRMPGQDRIRLRYQRTASPWFDYLSLAPDEIEGLIAGTGWQLTRVQEGDGGYSAELTLL
ncbi:methyltransferase domain-containing protein [Streptomyces sp. NPDC001922]|uniref:methyltransferase domain-containing protein n=1 Tax=Streptomyces sp. NPDC001922 TaxID=3364624 RepID=UPI00368C1066